MDKQEIITNLKRTYIACIKKEQDVNDSYKIDYCYGRLKECVRNILCEETGMIDRKKVLENDPVIIDEPEREEK